jgi:photosystem II stability/assembly factor-like uncharacterized protein
MKRMGFFLLVLCSLGLFAQDINKEKRQPSRLVEKNLLLNWDSRIPRNLKELERFKYMSQSPLLSDEDEAQKKPDTNRSLNLFPQANSSWKPIGPFGGDVSGLVVNPQSKNELYVLTEEYPANVFKSTDTGQTWTKLASLSDVGQDLAIDPQNPTTLYALGDAEIYKSMDGGSNWERYHLGSHCSSRFGQIAVNPNNSNILYVSGRYIYDTQSQKDCMALFKSTDGGQNWAFKDINLSQNPNSGVAYCVALAPTNPEIIFCGGYYQDSANRTQYKVYKSTDSGSSWTDVSPSNMTPNDIVIDPSDPLKVYVATSWGVYRSSDGGSTWDKNNGYIYAYAIALDPTDSNTIYAGYTDCCYKSIDGGENWTYAQENIRGICNRLIAFSSSQTKVFYGSAAGIYKSTDQGENWSESHYGIMANRIPSLSVPLSSPNIIYAEATGSGLFKSSDFGNTWTRLPHITLCDSVTRVAVKPDDADDLFILAGG